MNNAHALVVGIANYPNIAKLPNTVLADASDVVETLIDPNLCAYPPEQVRLLADGEATLACLRDELAALALRADPDSTVFIYFSSHGGRIESGPGQGEYLLPFDVTLDPGVAPPQIKADTALSGVEFGQALDRIQARKLLVVFDCCHAGGLGATKDATAPDIRAGLSEDYYGRLAAGRGRVVLASCRGSEFSYVMPGASNSLFTGHLLSGLRGHAPAPGGFIRIFDLFGYLQPKVVADQSSQHPIFRAEVEDNFPVALSVGGKGVTAAPAAVPADEFAYDLYLSYAEQDPDKTWVRKTLLPRLKSEGLKVIEERSFRLGAFKLDEMERAVTTSRYTLSVLSPAYMDDAFGDVDSVMAQHLGVENRQRRFLAVMREYCKPRLGMRARMWLDMTDDDEFGDSAERLVYELKQPPAA